MYLWNHHDLWIAAFIFVILCLVTSIFSYTEINLRLRHHQAQVHQGQPNEGGTTLDVTRYKRTVSSILWVQLALLVCYVPSCNVAVLRINEK